MTQAQQDALQKLYEDRDFDEYAALLQQIELEIGAQIVAAAMEVMG